MKFSKAQKLYLTLLSFASFFQLGFCEDEGMYKFSSIPKNLLANANMVVRTSQTDLSFPNAKSGVCKIKRAFTILKEEARKEAVFSEGYNRFGSINKLECNVYNQEGKKIKRFKGSDFQDLSSISRTSLFDDGRRKYLDPGFFPLPYTLEYTYEETLSSLLFLPAWTFDTEARISLEFSEFRVKKSTFNFRFWDEEVMKNAAVKKTETQDDIIWTISNLPAKKQFYSNCFEQGFGPAVLLAPNNFEIAGTIGNAETWENFGQWAFDLGRSKNNLSKTHEVKIKELVKGTDDDPKKVEILYAYFQEKTRYVSVQVGIGGWQPIDANVVERLSYGDCKGLSNYMMAILEAAGIKSYYCLVKAGSYEKPIKIKFPSSQFNHAFLCVPLKTDTIWLECTSQSTPMGFIGSFTDDRDVLLINDKSSKLVHTKVYRPKENKISRKVDLTIDSSGNCIYVLQNKWIGIAFEEMQHLRNAAREEREQHALTYLPDQNAKLIEFDFDYRALHVPEIYEVLSYSTQIQSAGNLWMVPIFSKHGSIIKPIEGHILDKGNGFFIRRSSMETDTIVYNIPKNLKIQNLPVGKELHQDFIDFNLRFEAKDHSILCIRKLTWNKGFYPENQVKNYMDSKASIYEIENQLIMMGKE